MSWSIAEFFVTLSTTWSVRIMFIVPYLYFPQVVQEARDGLPQVWKVISLLQWMNHWNDFPESIFNTWTNFRMDLQE